MMAAWTSDHDIARDLNALSEFKSSSGDIKFKSYTSSWGRGKVKVAEIDMPEAPISPEKCAEFDEFQWPQEKSIVKFPDTVSRGKKLEILQETLRSKGKAVEIREQVRAAGVPEYSNEVIEATFKPKQHPVGVRGSVSVKFDKVQFEDSEQDNIPKGTGNNISLNATGRTSSGTKADGAGNKKSKRRTYRNVALESLERINNSSEGVNHLAKIRLQFMDNSLQRQRPVGESTANNLPPSCYLPFRKISHSFEYSNSDFPEL